MKKILASILVSFICTTLYGAIPFSPRGPHIPYATEAELELTLLRVGELVVNTNDFSDVRVGDGETLGGIKIASNPQHIVKSFNDNNFNINVGTLTEQLYAFETDTANSSYTLTFNEQPASDKAGTLTLYLTEWYSTPNNHVQTYDIANNNIANYPASKPWMTSGESATKSIWEVNFKSIPGSTSWWYVDSKEYPIEVAQYDYFFEFDQGDSPSYSATSANFYNSVDGNNVAFTIQQINRGDNHLRLSNKASINSYVYNTTAFESTVKKISFTYANIDSGLPTSFYVYGSSDGVNWTAISENLITGISTTFTTCEITTTAQQSFTYIKLEVSGNTATSTNKRIDVDDIKIWLN